MKPRMFRPAAPAAGDRRPSTGPRARHQRPGRLVADVYAQGSRTLAFTERYHDGWLATSDGATVPTVRVEDDFLGCLVPQGAHEVTLRFMPRSFVYGSMLSAFGILLLAAGVLLRWR